MAVGHAAYVKLPEEPQGQKVSCISLDFLLFWTDFEQLVTNMEPTKNTGSQEYENLQPVNWFISSSWWMLQTWLYFQSLSTHFYRPIRLGRINDVGQKWKCPQGDGHHLSTSASDHIWNTHWYVLVAPALKTMYYIESFSHQHKAFSVVQAIFPSVEVSTNISDDNKKTKCS